MWLLLPYYSATLTGLVYYTSNIKAAAKKFWPTRTKLTFGNLLYIGTLHAITFFIFIVPGTFMVLGMNPFTFYNAHKLQIEEEMLILAQTAIELDGPKEQITQGVQLA